MRGLVKLRWFRYGDRFLHQVAGIPIGGPVSGAVLEGVLSIDEMTFDKFGWFTFSSKIGFKGPRERWITFTRYVDDVFAASYWFCPDCTAQMVDQIYANTIHFDAANDGLIELNGFRVIKFLDLWCYFSWNATYFPLLIRMIFFRFPAWSA